MTNEKKNLAVYTVSKNLSNYILNGIEFSTPVRDTGMMTTRGYYGGLRCSTIKGRIVERDFKKFSYGVFSYNTEIMRVSFKMTDNGCYVLDGAYFDNRKYSATTAKMQGMCYSALLNMFGLPYMPPVVGKRGGEYSRHNYMAVVGSIHKGWEWRVLDTETGELVKINQNGDPYNGDTEGYY